MKVRADRVVNPGGNLSSGTGKTLNVAVLLNKSQRGLIEGGAVLVVKAKALSNAAGN
ncbi:hypothetical protein, partial [Pseudomonas syringae group genomosp. 7]|uniref:hypothetical protein n=1 Tax=Pseudomonas syringae group genomosp. 7 TaxID=251699 RepID=UPI003770477E